MENKKMTNVMALTNAIEICSANGGSVELIEKLEKMLEQTEKKNSRGSKSKAKVEEHNSIKAILLGGLDSEVGMTVTEMLTQIPGLDGLTNQKVTSMLTQLSKDGLVVKSVEKRISRYTLTDEGVEASLEA